MLGEKEICSLLIKHPEKGLEKIMDQYTAFVYTIVHGKLSAVCNKQEIEECVSDIFYEVYKTRNYIDLEKGSLEYLEVDVDKNARNISLNITDIYYYLMGEYVIPLDIQ